MKIEVNVDQRFLFVLAGVLLVTWVFVFVGAYDSDPNAGDPIRAGHSTGEVDFTYLMFIFESMYSLNGSVSLIIEIKSFN